VKRSTCRRALVFRGDKDESKGRREPLARDRAVDSECLCGATRYRLIASPVASIANAECPSVRTPRRRSPGWRCLIPPLRSPWASSACSAFLRGFAAPRSSPTKPSTEIHGRQHRLARHAGGGPANAAYLDRQQGCRFDTAAQLPRCPVGEAEGLGPRSRRPFPLL
jgi:hypothetical protein